jgi:hypothetical protein
MSFRTGLCRFPDTTKNSKSFRVRELSHWRWTAQVQERWQRLGVHLAVAF